VKARRLASRAALGGAQARISVVVASIWCLSGCGTSAECANYLSASIAEMRQASGSGCFELAHVMVVARTPSTSTPRLYLQDAQGGDFTAIMAKCDASSSHPCLAATAATTQQLIDGSAVTVRGYYQQGSLTGFEELYLDAVVDEGTLLASAAAPALQVADLARAARMRAQWFQIVTASVAVEDPLVMYDFSPAEFALAGPCPAFAGFGMIPYSAMDSMVPVEGCAGDAGTTNPGGISVPDPREILIGRLFFKDFFASTDCACAAASKQHKLPASSALLGPVTIRGILILELQRGSSSSHQIFQPLAKGFPITER
jgi:hypothetical protein